MSYPVMARIANLPVNTRIREETGGACVISSLLIVRIIFLIAIKAKIEFRLIKM